MASKRRRNRTSQLKKEESVASIIRNNVGQTSIADLILARINVQKQKEAKSTSTSPPISNPTPESNPVAITEAIEETIEEKIIASDNQKRLIFAEALANREFYLNSRNADGQKLPWFRYVRKQTQYSEFVMLNSEMAKALLENIWSESDGNRKIKIWLKDGYKRDILNERWVPTDESIGIDIKGVVYNGRHRLTAMSELDIEWPFYITFNALEESKFTVDSGAKRNSAEKIRLVVGSRLGNRTTGFCKAIMNGLQKRTRYTETEIAEFAIKWESAIAWVTQKLPAKKAELQAAFVKAYLWYGPEIVEDLANRLHEVKFSEEGDPARVLYLTLQKAKTSRINLPLVTYKKTLSALDAALNGRQIQRLFEKDEDIFEWNEGWELPPGSWWEKNQNK